MNNDLRVHEIPEITLMYVTCVVTRDTMPKVVPPLLDQLSADMLEAGIVAHGNALLVYRGGVEECEEAFRLWVGVPVERDTKPIGQYRIATLPNFRCATRVHVGSYNQVDEAYGDLFQRIHEANLEPTPEIREEYLHHEPAHPDNDVTWLQVGVR